MEILVNIKANKLTNEQKNVLVDALTDYVAEEGDTNIARDLAVKIKKGAVILFENELKPQIYEYKGKKYALVLSDKNNECEQCSLRKECYKESNAICMELAGVNADEHYLKEIKQ